MVSGTPLVSVVMSAFNESIRELNAAIESMLRQTYDNIEIVIVLDNPDNFEIREYLLVLKEKNSNVITLFNDTNLGLALSLNRGIMAANGDYICRMDADDISCKVRIETEMEVLLAGNYDVVSTNYDYIDGEDNCIGTHDVMPNDESQVKHLLPYACFICHPSVLMKKSSLVDVGLYRDFRVSQDYDLWLRLLASGYKIYCINEVLLHYRIRDKSLSKSNRLARIIVTDYQKQLYAKRIRSGYDDFTSEMAYQRLECGRVKGKNEKTLKILDLADEGIKKRQPHSLFYAYILSTLVDEKEIRRWIRDLVKYTIRKRCFALRKQSV